MIKFISAPSFRILIILMGLVLLIVLMFSKTTQTLNDLHRVHGKVVESGVTTISNSKGNSSNIYTVQLSSANLVFGIKEYNSDLYDYFVANDPKGKELTIHYDSNGKLAANNLTLHVGQVQMGNEILLSLEDSKLLYYFGEMVFITLLLIFLPIYIWIIRREKRGSEKQTTANDKHKSWRSFM